MITDENAEIVSTHNYQPYGNELTQANYETNTHKFTGHERDAETGLDYMLARHCDSTFGRFLQVDPGYDYDPEVPMTWNLYIYVRANPIKAIDLSGKDTFFIHGTWSTPKRFTEKAASGFTNAAKTTFKDKGKTKLFKWTGGNTKQDRSKAAMKLKKDVIKALDADKPVNIVAHSHGGIVVFEMTQLLAQHNKANGTNYQVNNVVTLGTPIRDDYTPEMGVIGSLNLVSNTIDDVQRNGGYDGNGDLISRIITMLKGGEVGDSVRELDVSGANNVVIDQNTMNANGTSSIDYAGAHSAFLTEKFWNNVIDGLLVNIM
jgi:RHS repeat-associated protein